ncbi:MAG: T9SS type A sorting domain-containing protein [Bacteroidetes bacterium]|nr:T9SS type A sorting domain-containing protein [Bacteroidota bacterium]
MLPLFTINILKSQCPVNPNVTLINAGGTVVLPSGTYNDIIIDNATTVEINASTIIQMNPGNRIIVNPGSTLFINDGTIENEDDENILESELRIAQDIPVTLEYELGILELAKTTLYQRIRDSILDIDTSTVLQNFYSLNQNGRYNNFADASHLRLDFAKAIDDLHLDYEPQIQLIKSYLENKSLLLASIGTNSNLISYKTTLTNTFVIQGNIQQSEIAMRNAYLLKKPILDALQTNWSNSISSITDNTLMTTNLQQLTPILNKIVFDNLYSLTQGDIELVTTLANACPYTDGVAVNYAQGIIKSLDHTFVADNKYNCTQVGINYKASNVVNDKGQHIPFSIVDEVISLPIEIMQDYIEINVFDMYGKVIEKTNPNKNTIGTTSWPNGIYVLQVIRKNRTSRNYKFNLVK